MSTRSTHIYRKFNQQKRKDNGSRHQEDNGKQKSPLAIAHFKYLFCTKSSTTETDKNSNLNIRALRCNQIDHMAANQIKTPNFFTFCDRNIPLNNKNASTKTPGPTVV